MDEAMAARKVTANAEAYRNIKAVEGASTSWSPKMQRKKRLIQRNGSSTPGDFADHWLTLRSNLRLLAEKGAAAFRTIEHTENLQRTVEMAIFAAIGDVYKDAGIPRPEWERRMYAHLDETS